MKSELPPYYVASYYVASYYVASCYVVRGISFKPHKGSRFKAFRSNHTRVIKQGFKPRRFTRHVELDFMQAHVVFLWLL